MTTPTIAETDIAISLAEMLDYGTNPADTDMGEVECQTFHEAGVGLGVREGIVIYLADGSEYQLTIVKSKPAANCDNCEGTVDGDGVTDGPALFCEPCAADPIARKW